MELFYHFDEFLALFLLSNNFGVLVLNYILSEDLNTPQLFDLFLQVSLLTTYPSLTGNI
jgi:hypothetical protein